VQALLYDVHGNLPALEAVLADARAAGAQRWLLGGDYALFGGWPEDCLTRLRELSGAVWIRGNGERWTAHPGDAPDNAVVPGAIQACRAALGDALVESLAALPFDHVDGDTYACHASPVSDVRSFMPEPADDEPELLEGVNAGRVVFGHTHLAFRRARHGIELVNPGSVGMPLDGDPRAAYALVRDDGTLEHRRIAYDHGASARHLRERFPEPWADTIARRLEQARMVD
jgi:diadenosine tetraphosphatase ApaH/serine/threonine PP2A family protein phosphatase